MTLSCNASGTPPLMVSWIKVGSHMRTNQNELALANINRSETGEYRCEASNECGNASETVAIDVQCKFSSTCFGDRYHYSSLCNVCYDLSKLNLNSLKHSHTINIPEYLSSFVLSF